MDEMRAALPLLLLPLFAACAPAEKTQTQTASTTESLAAGRDAGPAVQVSPPQPSALEALEASADMHYDLGALAHFAVCGHEGSFRIDLGEASASKHLLGGWRTAWNPTPRRDGETTYLEANHEAARIFFKHRRGGFDRVSVRMRAVRRKNSVTVRLGDTELGRAELTEAWSEHVFDVPPEATLNGEHQLVLKIRGSLRLEGRPQYAHVDAVSILAPGARAAALPPRPRVVRGDFGGRSRDAVVAAQPQSWTWRVQLPVERPSLGLRFGGAEGVRVVVEAASDEVPLRRLFDADAAQGGIQKVSSLEAFAGQVVELRVSVRGAVSSGAPLALSGGIYGAPLRDSSTAAEAPDRPARHALVYLIDTLRYDKIGVYNPKSSVATPNFDAFARDATIFDAAYDTENWTKPSTASILTGLYPWNHRTKDGKSKLPESVPTIAQHLGGEGFETSAFIANGYVSKTFGFGRGWHRYTNYIREGKVTDAGNLVKDTLAWIDGLGEGERFFAYVHTIDPHVPYSAPGPWKFKRWKALDRGKYAGPIKAQSTGNQIADIKSGKLKPTPDDKAFFESLYDSEVAYNDHEFGRLVEGLKKRGIYDETAIIVLVDHGEEFWDHGSVGHGHSLFDEMVHTPFFVRHPSKVPTGRRVGEVVSAAATVPTILDLLGAPAMEGIDAASVLGVLDGVGEPYPSVAVTDFMYRRKSIRAGRYHWLTRAGDGDRLYDLETDRAEARDLKGTHPIARAYARGHFGLFMAAADHARWWEDAARSSAAGVDEEIVDVDDELQKQLEAMGYIEGATGEHTPEQDKALMKKEDGSD